MVGNRPRSIYSSLGPGLLNVMERPRPTIPFGLGPGSFMLRDWPRPTYVLWAQATSVVDTRPRPISSILDLGLFRVSFRPRTIYFLH